MRGLQGWCELLWVIGVAISMPLVLAPACTCVHKYAQMQSMSFSAYHSIIVVNRGWASGSVTANFFMLLLASSSDIISELHAVGRCVNFQRGLMSSQLHGCA